jgi:hypothetical protein
MHVHLLVLLDKSKYSFIARVWNMLPNTPLGDFINPLTPNDL